MDDAGFEIRIAGDGVLSTKSTIFLKLEYNCSCYEVRPPKKSEFIRVQGSPITTSDAIQAMVDYGVNPDCKHYILGGFTQNTDVQFTIVFLSKSDFKA